MTTVGATTTTEAAAAVQGHVTRAISDLSVVTYPGEHIDEVTWKTILATCFICAIVISGVVGNAIIILSIYRDPRLHTRGNFLIG